MLLVPLLLAGCSTLSISYNFVDWLLMARINHYFDLSAEQEGWVSGRLADLHTWHRKAELPRYVDFLIQVQTRWQDGLTAEEIDETFDGFQVLRTELAERVAAEGSVFLATVDETQIRHLEKEAQRDNRRWQSEVGMTPEARTAKRLKNVRQWAKDWLGRLTSEQEHLIDRLVRGLPDTADAHLAYRVHRQHELVQLLESKPPAAVIQNHLHDWMATPEKDAPPEYAIAVRQSKENIKRIVLEIDRTVTPRQRTHAADKLQKLIHQIQTLSAS